MTKLFRMKALVGNVHRLGCSNVATCNYDGRSFPTIQGGFDRVLLDAPCAGTGVIAKDPSAKVSKEDKDVRRIVHLQKGYKDDFIDIFIKMNIQNCYSPQSIL